MHGEVLNLTSLEGAGDASRFHPLNNTARYDPAESDVEGRRQFLGSRQAEPTCLLLRHVQTPLKNEGQFPGWQLRGVT